MRYPVLIGWAALFAASACAPLARADAPHRSVLEAQQRRIEVMEKASRATVAVMAGAAGGGSGVIISPDGYALSNFHVTQPAGNATKCGLPDGKLYDAVIVGVDPTGDVALIKLLGRHDFPHVELGDSDQLRVGDWVFVAGNPFLLASDFTPSISYGVVSGVHRYQYPAGSLLEYADCIQTDAAINPGNSGGPLFDSQGRLVGINGRGSFEKRGRVNVGVGYAISINQIKHFLGYLKSGRIVDHATLGATVATDEDGRVVVDQILETSDAYRRGLRYDDEIVQFGGREIRTVNAFKNVLGIYPQGWRVPLVFRRDGKLFERLVRLAPLHREGELEKAVRTARHAPPPKIPQPGEDPPKPGEQPQEKPGRRPAHPLMPAADSEKMPEIAARHFEARRGYMNYYFNQLNLRRVWQAARDTGDFSSAPPRWIFLGDLAGGGKAEVEFGPEVGRIRLPAGESKARFDSDLGQNLNPPGSGGLLLALHLWQRLMTVGPEKFGEVYYLGTMPLPGHREHVDVVVGIYGGIESNFYFHPTEGWLLGIETFAEIEQDPAEIYFDEFREVEGRFVPHRWQVKHGEATYLELSVGEVRFQSMEEAK